MVIKDYTATGTVYGNAVSNSFTMVTIYFDTHVFSHLYKCQEEKFQILRRKILEHKDEFIFLYSDAHLQDLYNDPTETKFQELEFMKEIVDGYHITYNAPILQVDVETPYNRFQSIKPIEDTSWIDEIDPNNLSDEQIISLRNSMDIIAKDLNGELAPEWPFTRVPLGKSSEPFDKESMKAMVNFVNENHLGANGTYKRVRDLVSAIYNPKHIRVDKNTDLNAVAKETFLESPFDKILSALSKQFGLTSPDNSQIYLLHYYFLDNWGLCPEKRKTVKARNLLIDSAHSYLASYCDCLVSDDKGMRTKSEVLYKRYGIDTAIYTIDEFIEKFDEAIANNQKSVSEYIFETIEDHTKSETIKIDKYEGRTFTHIKPHHSYFGYFNQMIEAYSENDWGIMLGKRNGLNQSILLREIEIIVNQISKVFANIGFEYQPFQFETESEQLKEDNWIGRAWRCPNFIIRLEKLKGYANLCLIISPLAEQSAQTA